MYKVNITPKELDTLEMLIQEYIFQEKIRGTLADTELQFFIKWVHDTYLIIEHEVVTNGLERYSGSN